MYLKQFNLLIRIRSSTKYYGQDYLVHHKECDKWTMKHEKGFRAKSVNVNNSAYDNGRDDIKRSTFFVPQLTSDMQCLQQGIVRQLSRFYENYRFTILCTVIKYFIYIFDDSSLVIIFVYLENLFLVKIDSFFFYN